MERRTWEARERAKEAGWKPAPQGHGEAGRERREGRLEPAPQDNRVCVELSRLQRLTHHGRFAGLDLAGGGAHGFLL